MRSVRSLCTSHLDVLSEQAVNNAIQQIALTRVVVAHRPETIGMAERVVVLHQGAVFQDVMLQNEQPTAEVASRATP